MKKILAAMFVCGCCFSCLQAALLTDSSSITGTPTVITFDGLSYSDVTTPVDLGDGVTVTGSGPGLSITDLWMLGDNGLWVGLEGFAAISSESMMTFSFTTPVDQVGGFMNYGAPEPCTISILGNLGQVLESYELTVSAPINTNEENVNNGAFRGFSRSAADIYGFRVSCEGIGAAVLDDLTFHAVPEPASALMLIFGAAIGMAVHRARRWANR